MSATSINRITFDNFLEAVNHDLNFLAEMLQTYFNDSPDQLKEMQKALINGNAADLSRAAHSFKSNSAVFGADSLSSLCKVLEDSSKNGLIPDDAARQIEQIEAEYQRVQEALKTIQREI
jgi:HPt (histidine-containing phosphotransfer) domain-containing protein